MKRDGTLSSPEEKIRGIVARLRQIGRTVPTSVVEIPNFPYPTFESLRHSVLSRGILLQRFSFHYESDLFTLLASPSERFASTAYSVLMFIFPVAALGLGYWLSWWWLLAGLAGPIAASKGMKRTYNRVILSSALRSELLFCYLYFAGQICLTRLDFGESLFWAKSIGEA